MKKVLIRTLYLIKKILLVLIMATGIAEIWFRYGEFYFTQNEFYSTLIDARSMNVRLQRQWLRIGQSDLFLPPFHVFSNKGYDNPSRLQMIAEKTKLPPGLDVESFDFIQSEESSEKNKYRIRTDDFGFRGQEKRNANKPTDVLRIVVLGSYQSFGHGVEDLEAYPARLEAILKKRWNRKVEVWNGGRHAATAIVGLARLNEVLSYGPDLLIFDYGMVDPFTWGDNFMPSVLRLPDEKIGLWMRKFLGPLVSVVGNSYVWQRMFSYASVLKSKDSAEIFHQVMQRMVKIANENKIPVVLVKQIPVMSIPSSTFENFVSEEVSFVETSQIFRNYKNHHIDEYKSSEWKGTWMDIPGGPPANEEHRWFSQYWPYRLNLYQLNSKGHEILADELAVQVDGLLKKKLMQK